MEYKWDIWKQKKRDQKLNNKSFWGRHLHNGKMRKFFSYRFNFISSCASSKFNFAFILLSTPILSLFSSRSRSATFHLMLPVNFYSVWPELNFQFLLSVLVGFSCSRNAIFPQPTYPFEKFVQLVLLRHVKACIREVFFGVKREREMCISKATAIKLAFLCAFKPQRNDTL